MCSLNGTVGLIHNILKCFSHQSIILRPEQIFLLATVASDLAFNRTSFLSNTDRKTEWEMTRQEICRSIMVIAACPLRELINLPLGQIVKPQEKLSNPWLRSRLWKSLLSTKTVLLLTKRLLITQWPHINKSMFSSKFCWFWVRST